MSNMSSGSESAAMPIGASPSGSVAMSGSTVESQTPSRPSPIKLLRLPKVMEMTGLRKTKIYELHAEGAFPRRVKITAHSVGWVEAEVQAWLARRVENSARESAIPSISR
jgi:prophage regulatory protein